MIRKLMFSLNAGRTERRVREIAVRGTKQKGRTVSEGFKKHIIKLKTSLGDNHKAEMNGQTKEPTSSLKKAVRQADALQCTRRRDYAAEGEKGNSRHRCAER